ncbi:MAG TPA: hypothetical protein VFG90_11235 [Nitrososphaeraceae archaeon]|nr:hypothetical protein [Nitrososphaeraceae archaeon]
MPEENITGPTILWTDLDDVEVKSNDGKKLGKIKKISHNHFRVEKGSIGKKSFWMPKNLADAYDGDYLWLTNNEEEIHDKFLYGEEPSVDEKITPVEKIKVVNERMKGVPTEKQQSSERYKNIRDLK